MSYLQSNYRSQERCRPLGLCWAAIRIVVVFASSGSPCHGQPASLSPAEERFSIQNFQVDQGLPQHSVNAIIQTRDDYIWLGTYGGLARFDGARFVVFDSANTAMCNSRVTSLFEDHQGNLWIGHETGELTRMRNGAFESVNLSNRWPGGAVQAIGKDEGDDLWLLNVQGAAMRLRDGSVLERFPGIGRDPGSAPVLARGAPGQLVVNRNGAAATIQDGRWLPLQFDNPSAFYSAVCPSIRGGFWVASGGLLRRWENNAWVQQRGLFPEDASFASVIKETLSGRVLVGTVNRGLILFEPDGTCIPVNREDGLPHHWIKCLLEDREGNLWVGTRSGLSVLRPRKIIMYKPPDGWRDALPLSIAQASNGLVWVGTEGAGLYRFDGGLWCNFGAAEGIASHYVWSVIEDTEGTLWAGTWSDGLFRGKNDRFEVPKELADLKDPITALMEFPAGTVWIGTGKGLARFQDGKLERLSSLGGAAAGDIRALTKGRDGEVWMGTMGAGLGRYLSGECKTYTSREGLPGNSILSLYQELNGTLWLGTLEKGLCRFKSGRFYILDSKRGLPNCTIGHINDDGRGNLWFNSARGIFSASTADLNRVADGSGREPLKTVVYGLSEGLSSLAGSSGFTPSGFQANDGRIWVPVAKGLAVVKPEKAHPNRRVPPVIIEELFISGHSVSLNTNLSKGIQIPPGSQQIQIRFTAPSFSAPEKVQFRWQLDGLEDEWTAPQTQRAVTYSYLRPGNYVFHISACNNDGEWNEGAARLNLVVLPFFWQTWWFKLAVVLFALFLVGGSVFWAQRRHLQRKLERAAREQELERERARIARDIHDDLGTSLTRIGMLSQTADETVQDPQRTSNYLAQIYSAAREMTRSMDEIVWAVNPRHDTLESLLHYLARFAHEFLTPAQIRCRLAVPVAFVNCPVQSETRHNVFLAVKETLHNAVRHSGASEVQVSFTIEPEVLRITISDNGRQSRAKSRPTSQAGSDRIVPGHGVANIMARLEDIGGSAKFTMDLSQGLKVEFAVPLSEKTQTGHPPRTAATQVRGAITKTQG